MKAFVIGFVVVLQLLLLYGLFEEGGAQNERIEALEVDVRLLRGRP